MSKKFSEIRKAVTPERREKINKKKERIMAEVRLLKELRVAREYSQATLAEIMEIPQSAVSKLEHQADAYISTIRRYLQAMGADIEIIAAFPDGTRYEIELFSTIGEPEKELVEA